MQLTMYTAVYIVTCIYMRMLLMSQQDMLYLAMI